MVDLCSSDGGDILKRELPHRIEARGGAISNEELDTCTMTSEIVMFGDILGIHTVIVFPEATIALISSPNWREVGYAPQITLCSDSH